MEFAKLTIRAALEGLRKRTLSAVELAQAVVGAVEACNSTLGAYLWFDREAVLKEAAAADEARAAGSDLPLLGIPLALKDNICVAGEPCGCASRMLEGFIAPYDSTVAERLRGAGAILAGRTNMDEFALGTSTESSAVQLTRNPAAGDYVPGGSSGGSAAAVAGGLALAALGSDTGGSVRQPASHCGCVGVKPGYGRISRFGVVACASSFDQVGVLTKSVADAALLVNIMAGFDPRDATTLMVKPAAWDGSSDLHGMRLGLPMEYFVDWVEPEVKSAALAAAERCRELGAEVIEVSLPHADYGPAAYCVLAAAELSTNMARFDGVRYGERAAGVKRIEGLYGESRGAGLGSEVKRRILFGTHMLSGANYERYFMQAQRVRALVGDDFSKAFECCDALLTPVVPAAARKLGESDGSPVEAYRNDSFVVGVNLAGVGALTVPYGTTAAGLPVGVQVIAPTLQESRLYRVASALEAMIGGGR